MLEVLLEIKAKHLTEDDLTPKKINEILAIYVEHQEYDLICEFLMAMRQIKHAKIDGVDNADKTAVEKIVQEIEKLLKNVSDPALVSLKTEFLDDKNNVKPVAKIPHNVFRCATMVIVAVFQMADSTKRKAALPYLNSILGSMGRTFIAFSSASNFSKKIEKSVEAMGKWQGNILQETEKKLKAIEKETGEKLEEITKEKEKILSELQDYKQDSMSGRTSIALRAEKGKPANNPIHDRLAMEAYWSRPLLTLLELIAVQYQYELFFVEKKAEQEMPFRQNNGSLNGYQKPKKMSELLSVCAKQLVDKTKSVDEVARLIETHNDLKNLDLAKRIQVARRDNFLGQRGPINLDVEDPLPGVTVPDNKIEDRAYVKGLYAKLSRISNMFGNKENSGLLPYDDAASKKHEGYALAIEKSFPYVVSIEDNTDVRALKGVFPIPSLALLYAINIQYRHQLMLDKKSGNTSELSQKLSTLSTALITETKTVEQCIASITEDGVLSKTGLIDQMESYKDRLKSLDKTDLDSAKRAGRSKQPLIWECVSVPSVDFDENRKTDASYVGSMHRKWTCIASMCRNQGDNCLLPLNETLAKQYDGYIEKLTSQCPDLESNKSTTLKRK